MMLQSGDYLTPRHYSAHSELFNDAFRLNKPILTYWTILSSFKLFGIHVFSLRIVFLFAGFLTLILTALMAHRAFKKLEITEFSLLILMTQINFLMASMRSIPDILLTLFLTLSAYGVFCVLTSNRLSRLGWWCFYIGAALAFETKGLLAVLFVVYTQIFLIIIEPQVFKYHRPTQIGAALTGLFIGFSWFVTMAILHGKVVFLSFFNDQIGVHNHNSIWGPFISVPGVMIMVIGALLPWSLLSLWGFLSERWFKSIEKPGMRIYQFILGWALLWVVILGLGSHISMRYLLPLMPLLAILIADSFWRLTPARRQRLGRYLLFILIPLLIVEGFIFFSIIGQLSGLTRGISCLLIFVCLTGYLIFILRSSHINYIMVSAWVIFIGMMSLSYPLSVLLLPEETEQIVKRLTEIFPDGKLQLNLVGGKRLAANIRLLTQNRINPISSKEPLFTPLLIDNGSIKKLNLTTSNQKKTLIAQGVDDSIAMDLVSGIFTWTLNDKIKQHHKEYFLIQ